MRATLLVVEEALEVTEVSPPDVICVPLETVVVAVGMPTATANAKPNESAPLGLILFCGPMPPGGESARPN